jgi:hypothetical protein
MTGSDHWRCRGSEVRRERASVHLRDQAPCLGRGISLETGEHPELDPLAEQEGSTMED